VARDDTADLASTAPQSASSLPAFGLHGYGVRLGWQLLLRRRWTRGLRYLIVPVNFWRRLEYEIVVEEGDFRSSDRVLDVGSPKLLSLYLAEKVGARVTATDIESYFVDEYALLRSLRQVPPQRLELGVEDGRGLSFADSSFDKVYSISVVEHVPEDGDSQCVREMARVLAPGGRCLLTVPFWPQSRTDYRDSDFYWSGSSVGGPGGRVFFQRRYSEEDLHARLIEASGLKLRKLAFVGEKVMAGSSREFCDYLPPVTGPIQPALSRLLLTEAVDDWRRLNKPLCALLVFEK
jgi:SAM-dependent methyltransferase